MNDRDDLIDSLCADLEPVKPAMPPDRQALLWLGISAVYVILVTAYLGPLRPNALQQLLTVPRFFVETAMGVVAIALVGVCAFRAAVPGRLSRRFAKVSMALLVIWLLQYVIGLVDPSLEPSMLGKREPCWLQAMLIAIPPMLVAFVLTRRLYPLNPLATSVSFSLAAGLLPALYMQLACMYVVPHILKYHILPGLAVALLGCVLAVFASKYRNNRRR